MVSTPPKITLEAARVNAKLTIIEAAEKVGVSRSTIINWEKDPSSIKVSFLSNIEAAYHYPADYIFFGD